MVANANDLDSGDKFGRTPLMYCVLGDRMECAEMLIKANCDVNKRDIGGRTSLHWAAHKVRILCHRYADHVRHLLCTCIDLTSIDFMVPYKLSKSK